MLPVTMTVSLTDPSAPMMMEAGPELVIDCWVLVVEPAGVTVKHSVSVWTLTEL